MLKLCPHHPTYKGKHRPRTDCLDCIKAYDREREKFLIASTAANKIANLYNNSVTIKVQVEGMDPIEITVA